MAQYDDSRNPFSSTPARSEGESPWGETASGAARGGLQLPGGDDGTWSGSKFQRPSPAVRQRNQWRQQQQLTPDFGVAASEPEPVRLPPSRNASLPSFGRGPVSPQPVAKSLAQPPGQPPAPIQPNRPILGRLTPPQPGQASGTGLQMHPHSFQGVQAGSPAPSALGATGLPSNVTPMRPSARRLPGTGAAATQAARALGADPGLGAEGGVAQRRSRPQAVRRRLANPPLPLLYLIRLVILGVGVAAIAGTLLSVLSPANMASSGEGGASPAQASNPTKATGALLEGTTASTIADLRLTSESTYLKGELEQLATLTPGLTPVAFAVDLDSGEYVDQGGAEPVAAASTIKVPILVAFLQQVDAGTMALNQAMVLQEEYVAGGSGNLRGEAVGTEYTALEVATRMIVDSDNTATNMMIAALGGVEALNQTFAAWGLGSTLLRSPLPDLDGTNTTSPKDLALLMALIDQGGLVTPRSRDRMFSIMQRTVNRGLIPSGISDGSVMANKTGDIATILGDVALVDVPNGRRYVLAVMVQRPTNDGRASELIRRMTETIHQEMAQPVAPVGNPNAAPLSPPGEFEQPGATGAPGEFMPQGEPGIPVIPVPVEVPPLPDRAPARDEVPPG